MATLDEQKIAQSGSASTERSSASVENYAESLLDAIKFRAKDVPTEIKKLKKSADFQWEKVMNIPPNEECQRKGQNAIHFLVAADLDKSSFPSESVRINTIRSLLEAEPDEQVRKRVLNQSDNAGSTALHHAALFRCLAVVKFLVNSGADLDNQNNKGFTPLHFAAQNPDNDKVACFLIDSGAKTNARTHNKLTPLHCAARHLCLKTVKRLLELLDGSELHPCNDSLHGPVEYARIAAQELESAPVGISDQFRRAERIKHAKHIVRILTRTYQVPAIPGTQGSEQSELSDARRSDAYFYMTMRRQEQQQGKQQEKQQEQHRFACTPFFYRKPVGEVLNGLAPWLAEASRLQWANVPGSVPEWSSFWIHFPANDVCQVVGPLCANSTSLVYLAFCGHFVQFSSLTMISFVP